jgi:hypothetical protein
MVHLFVPPSLRHFAPRRVLPSPSSRHTALEYDLVEALRPKLVVDLGAGDAVSFFTYCQSMDDHDIDGVCYAIDAWVDASRASSAATFEAVNAYGRRFYPGLYYVVKMAPYEARVHFAENSIDLLRVDGTRPEVIAGADVEAWYRRVRPGGVIAWHGASSESKLWPLLASRSAAVVFEAGQGLGLVLKAGGEPRGELLQLLFRDNRAAELAPFYAHVQEHLEYKRLVTIGLEQAGSR